jgi:metal-responsive CopG/Arc/MetJ family transcriptional regulator
MKRSINIPDKLHNMLKILAEKKGVNISSMINIAISEYIEKEEQKNKQDVPTDQS